MFIIIILMIAIIIIIISSSGSRSNSIKRIWIYESHMFELQIKTWIWKRSSQ